MDIGYGHTRRRAAAAPTLLLSAKHEPPSNGLWEPTAGERYQTGVGPAESGSGIVAEDIARAIRPRPWALSAPVCGDCVQRQRRAGKLQGRTLRGTNICNSRTPCRSHERGGGERGRFEVQVARMFLSRLRSKIDHTRQHHTL